MAAPSCGLGSATSRGYTGPQGLPLSRFPAGHQDVGGGCAALCCPMDALPHASATQLLCGPACPGPLGPSLLPHLCLYKQCHQPHHLQPHVPQVPRGLQATVQVRGRGAPEARSLPQHHQLQRRGPRDASEDADPQERSHLPSGRCASTPATGAIFQQGLRGVPLLPSPSLPPSLCLHSLHLLTARSRRCLPCPLWLAGPEEGDTSLLLMTFSSGSPVAFFIN